MCRYLSILSFNALNGLVYDRCSPFIYRILCLAKSTVFRNLWSVETQVCKFISTALTADGCCVILSEMPSNRYKLLLLKYGLLSTHPQQNQPSLIKQHCTNWRTFLITFLLARILTHCTCFTVNAFIIKQIGRRKRWLPEFYELLGYIILISLISEKCLSIMTFVYHCIEVSASSAVNVQFLI